MRDMRLQQNENRYTSGLPLHAIQVNLSTDFTKLCRYRRSKCHLRSCSNQPQTKPSRSTTPRSPYLSKDRPRKAEISFLNKHCVKCFATALAQYVTRSLCDQLSLWTAEQPNQLRIHKALLWLQLHQHWNKWLCKLTVKQALHTVSQL